VVFNSLARSPQDEDWKLGFCSNHSLSIRTAECRSWGSDSVIVSFFVHAWTSAFNQERKSYSSSPDAPVTLPCEHWDGRGTEAAWEESRGRGVPRVIKSLGAFLRLDPSREAISSLARNSSSLPWRRRLADREEEEAEEEDEEEDEEAAAKEEDDDEEDPDQGKMRVELSKGELVGASVDPFEEEDEDLSLFLEPDLEVDLFLESSLPEVSPPELSSSGIPFPNLRFFELRFPFFDLRFPELRFPSSSSESSTGISPSGFSTIGIPKLAVPLPTFPSSTFTLLSACPMLAELLPGISTSGVFSSDFSLFNSFLPETKSSATSLPETPALGSPLPEDDFPRPDFFLLDFLPPDFLPANSTSPELTVVDSPPPESSEVVATVGSLEIFSSAEFPMTDFS
jgi:hypothetical protein